MPLKVVFDLKVHRPWRAWLLWKLFRLPLLSPIGGSVLRVTLSDESQSIEDLSRDDGMPLIILEQIHALHIYILEQSIRWGTYIFGVGYGAGPHREVGLHGGPLSDEEARQTRGEFLEHLNKSVVLVNSENQSKRLVIKKDGLIDIALYGDDFYSGYRSIYTVLKGTIRNIHEVEIEEYRTHIPRSDDEIKALDQAQLGALSIPPR